MNGKAIFKPAVRVMGQVCTDIIEQQDYQSEDVDLIIPHQANMRIIESLAKRLDISLEKFHITLSTTSIPPVPIALDEAVRAGRVQSVEDLILLVAFGAGLTWAATLIKWQ